MKRLVDNTVESVKNSRKTGRNSRAGQRGRVENCVNIFEIHPEITRKTENYGNHDPAHQTRKIAVT